MSIPTGEPPLSYLAYTMSPDPQSVTGEELLDRFLEYVRLTGLELYPAQEQAVLELCTGNNVILSTPTGSGKSLVATALHFVSLARQTRSFYTAPIKALVNEKFFALCRDFGAPNVGMLTGDASVNADAPILCCTAEILASMALRSGKELQVDSIVCDEFHYYADRDRGTAWQIPLLTLPQATFLLMSATLGDGTFFQEKLTRLTGKPTSIVQSSDRPVPLDYEYRLTPLHETLLELMQQGKKPVYIVNFTQRACAEEAQNLMSTDYCDKAEKQAINLALRGVRFDSPYGKDLQRYVRHGIGLHHAGLLPKYRLLVEKLAQKGLLKVIVGTDTLGVGVNIPIRTVLFTKLCKFDGERTALLRARDFHQIAGRAGRRGFDNRGSVVAQAPEHVIENLKLEAKATKDPNKRKKIVKKKPPERGYVAWDQKFFERIIQSPPEPLTSKFQVSHGMLVQMLNRGSGGCRSIARIIYDCHESDHNKRQMAQKARAMFQSLLDAEIVKVAPDRSVSIDADLQEDFSLNHALSLFLVQVIDALEVESPFYALDLLSAVESILENPTAILIRQLDRIKTEKLAELKAAGVEYEQRMEELEKLDYPKPNAEFIYEAFNVFSKNHPWLEQENIRPKSIAREMYESFQSFREYVSDYGLERSEGLLLRYLSDVYKTLSQTVPDQAKTPEVEDIVTFLEAIVKATDCSLVLEWESLQRANADFVSAPSDSVLTVADQLDVTQNEKAFMVLVRNAIFGVLRSLARQDLSRAQAEMEGSSESSLAQTMLEYFEENDELAVDPRVRSPQYFRVLEKSDAEVKIEQILCNSEEPTDWVLRVRVDRAASREAGHPKMSLLHLGPLSAIAEE
jgi:superfamily II RNA helicase